MRALAFAYRDWSKGENRFVEEAFAFVGLAGMIDPPREETKPAVAKCRAAGVRSIMVTRDHPATAAAIAKELGITSETDRVVTGQELDRLSDRELPEEAEQISVYARVTAEHKLRVVRAWKSRGEVVAMTGDGVNDVPAVKAAEIGIAMGPSGTDVTREAPAMILMDDSFASIVSAVEEGRAIYDNIQKFLTYLLSCNIGEMLLMMVSGLLRWPAPLEPVQLLWINLVTDGLPALALGLEPPEPGVMRRRPRRPLESMPSLGLGAAVLAQGVLLAVVALTAFGIVHAAHSDDDARARTMTFCVVVYGELFRALAALSKNWTFVQLGPFTNPYMFGAVARSIEDRTSNADPSGGEAAGRFTGGPSFSLESALDHPLSGYVILPLVGAAIGAMTHSLQALLHRAMSTPQDHEQHPWKLRHSTLLGAGVGLGQAASRHLGHAVSQHLQHLHHRKHAAWRTPVAARLFVEAAGEAQPDRQAAVSSTLSDSQRGEPTVTHCLAPSAGSLAGAPLTRFDWVLFLGRITWSARPWRAPELAAVDVGLHLDQTAHDREQKWPHLGRSLATRADFRTGRAIRRHLHRLRPRKPPTIARGVRPWDGRKRSI